MCMTYKLLQGESIVLALIKRILIDRMNSSAEWYYKIWIYNIGLFLGYLGKKLRFFVFITKKRGRGNVIGPLGQCQRQSRSRSFLRGDWLKGPVPECNGLLQFWPKFCY